MSKGIEVKAQAVEVKVKSTTATKVSTLAALNTAVRDYESQAKALKAEIIVEGGGSAYALYPAGVVLMYNGRSVATIKEQSRDGASPDALRAHIDGVLAVMVAEGMGESHPQIMELVKGIPEAVIKGSTFPVVRTK